MQTTYDRRTIAFHWITVVLVVGLWTVGQCIDFFPKGTPRVTARSLHILFGIVLAATLAARIKWRLGGGTALPRADAGLAGTAAVLVHRLLYALMIAIVVIGIAAVWIRGDNIFNLFTVPAFDPANKALRHDVVELHGLLANILLFVAGAHAAAALFHHFVRKDGVLRRMLKP
jgi:cytochrome b561